MSDPLRAIVAFELDHLHGPAGVFREIRAGGAAFEEAIRNAGLYREVDPIISPRATAEDVAWFQEHGDRTHRIREAFDRETVLRDRSAASHVVVVKQIRPGQRLLCAIAESKLITSASDESVFVRRIDRDSALVLLFDYATRFPGTAWDLDKIIAQADGIESRAPSIRMLS